MTDFAPLIANPKSFLLGAAAQFGIFAAYLLAIVMGFNGEAAAAIVVTKNATDYGVHNTKSGKDMIRIPAFAFLYLLGYAEKNGYQGID